ncbi:phenylacetate--CoA ligase family protein [Pseudonocardia nigra]|uniref:phenylacetate--CoA ligase family protein n=1 Tax=Pseudonocardia nigra TaxID=1921578 RepID=UPI001C5CFEAF|nr:AMP-binding protein [Pseudonocardia nigra]
MSTARPFSERYWDEVETWSRDRIAEHQLAKLRQQLTYVYGASGFYRRQWDDLGFTPGDLRSLEDLRHLPLVAKADYVATLEESPPWGSALAAPLRDVRRVHFSSGTTSSPTPVCWTESDLDRWADVYARAAYSQGTRDTDVFQCLFTYSWFVGGLGFTSGYGRVGTTVVPGGAAETERQIETIFRYGTTAVAGTPSFMVHIADTADALGRPLRESAVRSVTVGGEPGGAVPATRARIEELWGAKCFDGYGSLEFQPIAWECEEQAGGHLPEDFAYAEVLDADSRQPVPDGSPGVLVLTHLDKKATPLVRWWTGDVVVRDASPCACGRARRGGLARGMRESALPALGVDLGRDRKDRRRRERVRRAWASVSGAPGPRRSSGHPRRHLRGLRHAHGSGRPRCRLQPPRCCVPLP